KLSRAKRLAKRPGEARRKGHGWGQRRRRAVHGTDTKTTWHAIALRTLKANDVKLARYVLAAPPTATRRRSAKKAVQRSASLRGVRSTPKQSPPHPQAKRDCFARNDGSASPEGRLKLTSPPAPSAPPDPPRCGTTSRPPCGRGNRAAPP